MKHIDWYRSKKGVISTIYSAQKKTSKRRTMDAPSYTKKELTEWLNSQHLFHELFDSWKASGYNKWMKPSIDRKSDYLPYTLSNIQLMTWRQNQDKAYEQERSGVVRKLGHTKVRQLSMDGQFMAEYESYMEAKRTTGIDDCSIALCAKGLKNKKHAGGFLWEIIE